MAAGYCFFWCRVSWGTYKPSGVRLPASLPYYWQWFEYNVPKWFASKLLSMLAINNDSLPTFWHVSFIDWLWLAWIPNGNYGIAQVFDQGGHNFYNLLLCTYFRRNLSQVVLKFPYFCLEFELTSTTVLSIVKNQILTVWIQLQGVGAFVYLVILSWQLALTTLGICSLMWCLTRVYGRYVFIFEYGLISFPIIISKS